MIHCFVMRRMAPLPLTQHVWLAMVENYITLAACQAPSGKNMPCFTSTHQHQYLPGYKKLASLVFVCS